MQKTPTYDSVIAEEICQLFHWLILRPKFFIASQDTSGQILGLR